MGSSISFNVRPRGVPARVLLAPFTCDATVIGVQNLIKGRMFPGQAGPVTGRKTQQLCLACSDNLRFDDYGLACASCGSHWWNLGRVERDGWHDLVRYLRYEAAPISDPVKGRPCMECGERMSVVHGPGSQDGGVPQWTHERIDVCCVCDKLWLDPAEFDGLDHDHTAVHRVEAAAAAAAEAHTKKRLWRR